MEPHGLKPHEVEFFNFLNGTEKKAEAMETNEMKTTQGENPQDPVAVELAQEEERQNPNPTKPTELVQREIVKDREGFLRRMFSHDGIHNPHEKAAHASESVSDRARRIFGY